MRSGRLLFRIYVGCLLTVLAAVALSFLLISRMSDGFEQERGHINSYILSNLVRARSDAGTLRQEVDRLRQQTRIQASLYSIEGALLASTAHPPIPPPEQAVLQRLYKQADLQIGRGRSAHAFSEAGQLVAFGVIQHRPPPGRGPQLTLACFLVLLLVTAVVLARQIVRPLRQISDAADRFGRGELSARTGVRRSDEIGATARAFDEMAARITRLMRSQQELLANVSHELRTPLSRMHVAVDLMVDGVDDRARELLPEIAHDLAELERLVDDILSVARLELSHASDARARTPLQLAQQSIAELVERAASRFRAQYQSHPLVTEIEPDLPTLCGDGILLRRTIENLIDNARKYSEPGNTIRVTAHAHPVDGRSGVRLEVSDTGIGLDKSDLQRIFTPFFRSDRSRSRATGGVGLGLALARRIVEAHGGTIALTSELGRGTTVWMDLPISPSAQGGSAH